MGGPFPGLHSVSNLRETSKEGWEQYHPRSCFYFKFPSLNALIFFDALPPCRQSIIF
ncbi:MAG: hypothetical protein Q8942_09300 [Bacillota bacterium]|nr:hypothetical protein [Bacillota bacterium]